MLATNFNTGDIVNLKGLDYVVVDKKGIKEFERFNEDWHDDVHEIRKDLKVFQLFALEFIEELSICFPKVHKTLSRKDQLKLAACLWKNYARSNK